MSNRAWFAAKRRQLVLSQRSVFFFDPVLNIAASVLHLDHFPGREHGLGHDEPDPWEEFPVTREGEQRMKAVLSEMTVERHVLLLAVRRVFR